MKRMLRSPRLYVSIFLSLFILLRPLSEAFVEKPNGTFLQFLSVPFAASDYTPFAAIFCVLPFSGSFCEDYNSGYFKFIILRTGEKKYAYSRCILVMLSGGIMMAITVSIVILTCAFFSNMPETVDTAAFMRTSIWASMGILIKHQWILAILKILLAFLFGSAWAMTGLLISVLYINRYVTCIAPFVIYQILWFLLEGNAFNPVYLLRGDSNFIPSFSFIVIYQMIWISVCFLTSYIGIRKRVTV